MSQKKKNLLRTFFVRHAKKRMDPLLMSVYHSLVHMPHITGQIGVNRAKKCKKTIFRKI